MKYCLILDDEFKTLNKDVWGYEIQRGGFGSGSFEWTTDDPKNVYTDAEGLHIVPTLTTETTSITKDQLIDNYVLNLTTDGTCTGTGIDNCSIRSNKTAGTIINPVRSGRISTKGKKSITFGKVEVVAKMPQGDWLWPAIWMMVGHPSACFDRRSDVDSPRKIRTANGRGPVKSTSQRAEGITAIIIPVAAATPSSVPCIGARYRRWMHSSRPAGSIWFAEPTTRRNFIHSVLSGVRTICSHILIPAYWYVACLHVACYSWPQILTVLQQVFFIKFNKYMWDRGGFSKALVNNSALYNPWAQTGHYNTPFDQSFYLILNVAVGGTNGFFPNGIGNKPWGNESPTAPKEFWDGASNWLPTWGEGAKRGLTVKSVKMWKQGAC